MKSHGLSWMIHGFQWFYHGLSLNIPWINHWLIHGSWFIHGKNHGLSLEKPMDYHGSTIGFLNECDLLVNMGKFEDIFEAGKKT